MEAIAYALAAFAVAVIVWALVTGPRLRDGLADDERESREHSP